MHTPHQRVRRTHYYDYEIVLQTAADDDSVVSFLGFFAITGSARSAGYDLRSAYDCVVPAMGKAIVKTDIQIRVPEGTYGRIAPRSGLAAKHHIDVGAGVVDEDYTGNVGVVLFNHAPGDFSITKGDRIAQLVCEKIEYPILEECKGLEETERGAGGFGSTGSN